MAFVTKKGVVLNSLDSKQQADMQAFISLVHNILGGCICAIIIPLCVCLVSVFFLLLILSFHMSSFVIAANYLRYVFYCVGYSRPRVYNTTLNFPSY